MDLIDRSALMRCIPAEEIASRMAVANAPTIEERKTGHWILHKNGLILKDIWGTCSVCGNILRFENVNAGRGDANYCPNCGARMEG